MKHLNAAKGRDLGIKHRQPSGVTRHNLVDDISGYTYAIHRDSSGTVTVIGYTERDGHGWLARRARGDDPVRSSGEAPHTKAMFWLDGDPGVSVENGELVGTPEGFESASAEQVNIADLKNAAADAAERELEGLASGGGRGFQVNADIKRAIDDHAMDDAKAYYKSKRWKVQDVHIGSEIDLVCRNGGDIRHVEVKGTTTDGREIIITRNERSHAENCAKPERCQVVELYVLRRIKIVKAKNRTQVPTGGDPIICSPWILDAERLTPISYRYRLLSETEMDLRG